MQDQHKTKAQLVSELAELRQHVAGWEAKDAEQTRVEQAWHVSEEESRQAQKSSREFVAYCLTVKSYRSGSVALIA